MEAAAPAAPSTPTADAGSIVLGWLTRVTLTLTLLGVAGFEVLSIAVAHVSIEDYGKSAGQAAVTTFDSSDDVGLAYQSASAVADEHGATIPRKSFQVMPDGSVTFDIRTTATTLVLFRLDLTASLAEVSTTIYEEPFEQAGQQP
jgi:hypothetical protein